MRALNPCGKYAIQHAAFVRLFSYDEFHAMADISVNNTISEILLSPGQNNCSQTEAVSPYCYQLFEKLVMHSVKGKGCSAWAVIKHHT